MPIKEFHLQKVLNELDLNMDEFIDLCILLGCDYCESIRGIGPKRAIELIRQHKNIEEIIKHLDGKKYTTPSDWMFNEARKLFKEPEVADSEIPELKWNEPDEEGLVKFLCGDKGFSEERVQNGAKKLIKGRHGSTQGRLDSFFKVIPGNSPVKRKANETKESGKKKSKTVGSNKKFRRPK